MGGHLVPQRLMLTTQTTLTPSSGRPSSRENCTLISDRWMCLSTNQTTTSTREAASQGWGAWRCVETMTTVKWKMSVVVVSQSFVHPLLWIPWASPLVTLFSCVLTCSYSEVQYNLGRWEDLSVSRQGMFDDTYHFIPTQGWMFVPLIQYHGGRIPQTS